MQNVWEYIAEDRSKLCHVRKRGWKPNSLEIGEDGDMRGEGEKGRGEEERKGRGEGEEIGEKRRGRGERREERRGRGEKGEGGGEERRGERREIPFTVARKRL